MDNNIDNLDNVHYEYRERGRDSIESIDEE
jgi:hypothetical protein